MRGRTIDVRARELGEAQIERWWPQLTATWPAFAQHYAARGERTVFLLEPVV